MNNRIVGYNSLLPTSFRRVTASAVNGRSFLSGDLVCDKLSKFYPARSDEKVMREDVIASIIIVCEMLEKYPERNVNEVIDLYVANGVFIEDTGKHMDKVMAMYKQIDLAVTESDKMKKLFQSIPPLLALQTLTNSTMSFIAQYANIKGDNATFGNTSHAGFYALDKALSSLRSGQKRKAVVCASNCGGIHSFLTFSTMADECENWKESAVSACLLFDHAESDLPSHGRIKEIKSNKEEISLYERSGNEAWVNLLGKSQADLLIFGGAYAENDYVKDAEQCRNLANNCFSFFPEYGNLGSANCAMAIIKAIQTLKEGAEKVDILDRDAYGRCTYMRIEK